MAAQSAKMRKDSSKLQRSVETFEAIMQTKKGTRTWCHRVIVWPISKEDYGQARLFLQLIESLSHSVQASSKIRAQRAQKEHGHLRREADAVDWNG